MANPKVLAAILRKLVRINASVGTPTLNTIAADIATIDALVVVADTAQDAAQDIIDAAESGDIGVQIAAIQTQLDATPK